MDWETVWHWFLTQSDYALRLLIAGGCGAAIGYERISRMKEAGIRTHLIVCLTSSLMMIVSKYGFFDVLVMDPAVKLDPSRVASGIVTAVGFLGAGMIFINKQNHNVTGLTTSAGIWATVGIGMAIGSGMFALGIFATVAILLAQVLLHRNFKWLHVPQSEQIILVIKDRSSSVDYVKGIMKRHKIEVKSIKVTRLDGDYIDLEALVKVPDDFDKAKIMELFQSNPDIRMVEF